MSTKVVMLLLLAILAQSLFADLAAGNRVVSTEVSASGDVSPCSGANAVDGIPLLRGHCQQLVRPADKLMHPCGNLAAHMDLTLSDETATAMLASDTMTVMGQMNMQGPAADRALLSKIS